MHVHADESLRETPTNSYQRNSAEQNKHSRAPHKTYSCLKPIATALTNDEWYPTTLSGPENQHSRTPRLASVNKSSHHVSELGMHDATRLMIVDDVLTVRSGQCRSDMSPCGPHPHTLVVAILRTDKQLSAASRVSSNRKVSASCARSRRREFARNIHKLRSHEHS